MNPWATLGIASTQDEDAIRKAYAARVRQWRPDEHPKEFARLREAYEQALRWARQGAAPVQSAPLQAQGAQPAPPLATAPRPPAEAPRVPEATAETMVAEIARCYSEAGEREAVGLLREQFAALKQQTIDARLEWEQVFLHSLLAARTPPVVLLFEGDRLLHWREREFDVVQMFGDEAAQRLRGLLEMGDEVLYARYFSPNPWHRRLFAGAPPHWFGWAPQVAAARGTATWWQQAAERPGFEGMQGMLDRSTLARLEGLLLLSTDVWFALLAGWLFWVGGQDPLRRWLAPAIAAAGFLLCLLLPLLVRWLPRTRAGPKILALRSLGDGVPGLLWFIVGAVLFGIGMVAALGDTPIGVQVFGWCVVVSVVSLLGGLVLLWTWRLLQVFEVGIAAPWLWLRRCWSLHAFHEARDGRGVPGGWQSLRQLPAALARSWRAARAERKSRRRQQQERKLAAAGGGASFNWWWIFGAIALLNALVRLAK